MIYTIASLSGGEIVLLIVAVVLLFVICAGEDGE